MGQSGEDVLTLVIFMGGQISNDVALATFRRYHPIPAVSSLKVGPPIMDIFCPSSGVSKIVKHGNEHGNAASSSERRVRSKSLVLSEIPRMRLIKR